MTGKTTFRIFLFSFFLVAALVISQPTASAATKHKIAWQSMVGEEFQIFMADFDNPTKATQITHNKYGSKHPTLANDTNRIYYYRFHPTNWGDGDQLFYLDFGDSKERLVQRNAIHFEMEPCVSRNGAVLTYCSKQSIEGKYGTNNWEVICLKTDFSVAQRITSTINDERDPFMNGNGEVVYYTVELIKDRTETEKDELRDKAKEKGEKLDENSSDFKTKTLRYIYKNNFNSDSLERVTSRNYNAWHPSITADERWMVFESDMDGNSEIYLMDLKNQEIKRLTENASYDGNPCISSNGEVILFVSDRDGDKEIFAMDIHGNDIVQITENDVEDDNPYIT